MSLSLLLAAASLAAFIMSTIKCILARGLRELIS